MKQTIKRFALLLLLITGQLAFGQQNDENLIRKAYESYKAAILNDKGQKAVKYINSRTINYYSSILTLVKTADSAKIETLPILDKLMVFSIKHRATKKDILRFNGKSLLIYAIKNGMVGKSSVANHAIGEVIMDKGFAKGQFIANGQKTTQYYHFYKEKKQWKIDLTSLFPASAMAFEKMVDESGQNQNDYLFYLLEMATGKKPGPEMWKPIN